jgi:hypothetical protein
MMRPGIHPVTLVLILLVMATACTNRSVDSSALVAERVADRVAALSDKLRRECREDVIEVASARADSLLIDRARRMRRIEGRPPKPVRPGAPPEKELSNPLPLRPLFPFEIRFDPELRDSLRRDSFLRDSLLLLGIPQDSLLFYLQDSTAVQDTTYVPEPLREEY